MGVISTRGSQLSENQDQSCIGEHQPPSSCVHPPEVHAPVSGSRLNTTGKEQVHCSSEDSRKDTFRRKMTALVRKSPELRKYWHQRYRLFSRSAFTTLDDNNFLCMIELDSEVNRDQLSLSKTC